MPEVQFPLPRGRELADGLLLPRPRYRYRSPPGGAAVSAGESRRLGSFNVGHPVGLNLRRGERAVRPSAAAPGDRRRVDRRERGDRLQVEREGKQAEHGERELEEEVELLLRVRRARPSVPPGTARLLRRRVHPLLSSFTPIAPSLSNFQNLQERSPRIHRRGDELFENYHLIDGG